jgi:hypothetical protein
MAILIRGAAGHDWGWYSREDQRMHVQTVDADARSGPLKAKAWLENRGRRTFERAVSGKLSGSEWSELQSKVAADREGLEDLWIAFMIRNDWLKASLRGSSVTLTAYPGTAQSFTRTIDLREQFPGAYQHRPTWDENPPVVEFDREHGLLTVGYDPSLDTRDHLSLREHLFVD